VILLLSSDLPVLKVINTVRKVKMKPAKVRRIVVVSDA